MPMSNSRIDNYLLAGATVFGLAPGAAVDVGAACDSGFAATGVPVTAGIPRSRMSLFASSIGIRTTPAGLSTHP